METEEIIGTVPVTLQGFFEEFTGTFRGTACIEGYELQYPRDKYSGQMDGDEIVFWLPDSEMTYIFVYVETMKIALSGVF